MKIAGAILAAGASTRLGRPKQLLAIARGDGHEEETLLARTIRIARSALHDEAPLTIILGAHADEIASAIAPSLTSAHATRIDNPAFAEGMGTSVRVAATWAESLAVDALLLMVCDQPRLSSAHLERLVAEFESSSMKDIGSAYGGSIGVPAIFSRVSFADLAKLEGDRGAKSLLKSARSLDWPDGLVDLDTNADVAAFSTPEKR